MAQEGAYVDSLGLVHLTGVRAMVPRLSRTGDNFAVWKRNIMLYCEVYDANYHLFEDKSRMPAPDTGRVEFMIPSEAINVLYRKCAEAEWARKEDIALSAILDTVTDRLIADMQTDGYFDVTTCTAAGLLKAIASRYSNTGPGEYQRLWERWVTMRWDSRDDFSSFCDEWQYRLKLLLGAGYDGIGPLIAKEIQSMQFITVIKECGLFEEWQENQLTPGKNKDVLPVAELVVSARENWRQRQRQNALYMVREKDNHQESSTNVRTAKPCPVNVPVASVDTPAVQVNPQWVRSNWRPQSQTITRALENLSRESHRPNLQKAVRSLLKENEGVPVHPEPASAGVHSQLLETEFAASPTIINDEDNV